MLTSFTWVPRGGMRTVPLKTDDTMEQVREKLMRMNPDYLGTDEDIKSNKVEKNKKKANDEESADEESDDDENNIFHRFGGNIAENVASDDEEEKDDTEFKPTDLVFACTRADEDEPKFELFVYDDINDSIYVHHDANVSAYPLCSSWLSDGQLSMLALGTMLPFIEIWPLDVQDAVEPAAVLGGCTKMENNYLRRIKPSMLKPDSHSEAVLSVDWNINSQHILASGSADETIKIWDLNTKGCIGTYRESAKVQTVQFHHQESNLLLSGGFDNTVIARDCRRPDTAAMRWVMSDVIEHTEWAFHANQIVASTSDGRVSGYEARMNSVTPVWSVAAHDGDATFGLSRHLPGLMATGGKDGYLSLWDIRCDGESVAASQRHAESGNLLPQGSGLHNNISGGPTLIISKKYKTGAVMSIKFHTNFPSVLGACGDAGEPLVYTITDDISNFFTVPIVNESE